MSRQRSSSDAVRTLYESLPYPARDPAEEDRRLVRTSLDYLPKISHYGFAGRLHLRRPLRVLVAGGGTGDSLIFLAEQLRRTEAELVYLDLSEASTRIARERALRRGLENIRFCVGSIDQLDPDEHGHFDFINCSGVLHHLPDPDAGLKALGQVLADDGVIGLMVYARYGRTAVYQIQSLIDTLTDDDESLDARIEVARKALDALAPGHWWKRSEELHTDHKRYGDAGLADLFLNPIDQAYTVPDLYRWLERCDMALIDYADHRLAYDPASYVRDPKLARRIAGLSREDQQAAAELLSGTISKHTVYVRSRDSDAATARPSADMIPVPAFELDLADLVKRFSPSATGQSRTIEKPGARLNLPVNPVSIVLFRSLDGHHDISRIANRLVREAGSQAPEKWLRDQIDALVELLVRADLLHLVDGREVGDWLERTRPWPNPLSR